MMEHVDVEFVSADGGGCESLLVEFESRTRVRDPVL